MTDEVPQFPQYDPPKPQGIPIAEPKFHKPLYKLMSLMLKPRAHLLKTPFKAPRVKRSQQQHRRKVKYY